MKRGGTIGSAAGVLLMAAFFLRGGTPSPSGSPVQSPAVVQAERPPAAPEKGGGKVRKLSVEGGPWKASRDHFAGRKSICETPADQTTGARSSYSGEDKLYLEDDGALTEIRRPRFDLWAVPRCESVQAMVAIVPDPVHTHLALAFDRTIEALQLAAESGNYVVDRYWLPWGDEGSHAWSDYESFKQERRDLRNKEEQPGLLLFRWNGNPKQATANILYVFLVADTSTFGMNGFQFKHAVDYVRQVCDDNRGCRGADSRPRIHVLGPTFSGSLASLTALTARSPSEFKVFSGTISSACAIQNQKLAIAPEGLCPPEEKAKLTEGTLFSVCSARGSELTLAPEGACDPDDKAGHLPEGIPANVCATQNQELVAAVGGSCPQDDSAPKLANGAAFIVCSMEDREMTLAPVCPAEKKTPQLARGITFKSFVAPSETSISRFIEYLKTAKEISCTPGHPEVAILSEAATTFGAAQRPSGRYMGKLQTSAIASVQSEDVGLDACYAGFSYPREISSLRNAYHASAGDVTGSKNGDASRPYLSFNLSDQQSNSSDEPPDFSKQQSPLSKEAVLMKVVSELRNNRYKLIGVVGTNGLDVLFLSNFLRTAYPDARVFLISSDLLFERELDNASFVGTLSVSTYPLVTRNLDWTTRTWPKVTRSLDRLPFSDQFEEGQYNAIVGLLQEMMPYPRRLEGYEMRAPFHATSEDLPQWLTVVGTDGYWPVRLLTSGEREHRGAGESAQGQARDPMLSEIDFSLGWQSLVVVLCVVAFLHSMVLLLTTPASPRFRDFSLVAPMPGQRLFLIHAGAVTLALALAMMARPAWQFDSADSRHIGWIATAAEACLFFLLFTCLLLEVSYVFQWLKSWNYRRLLPRLRMAGWLIAHLALWAFAWYMWRTWSALFTIDPGGSLYGFFFAFRSVHMATGVSPATPMVPLLTAGYLWSIFEVWRIRFNDEFRPRLNRRRSSAAALPPAPRLLAGAGHEREVAGSIRSYLLATRYTAGFLMVFALWLTFFNPFQPFQLFEARQFRIIYVICFSVVVLMLLSSGFRFAQIWSPMRKMLADMERSPIRFTFRRIKDSEWSPIWRQGGEELVWINLARTIETLRKLAASSVEGDLSLGAPVAAKIGEVTKTAAEVRDLSGSLQRRNLWREMFRAEVVRIGWWWVARRAARAEKRSGSESKAGKAAARLNRRALMRAESAKKTVSEIDDERHEIESRYRDLERKFAAVQSGLADLFNDALPLLEERWTKLNCMPEEESRPAQDSKDAKKASDVVHAEAENQPPRTPALRQVGLMEEFVARRYEAFIRSVLGHMKHLLVFQAISFTLVLISLNLYAFEPHRSVIWSLTVIFFVLGLLTVMSLMQIHRDPILSRMSGTQPNDLGVDFYIRIVSFGAAPLITLLATHFPSIGRYVTSFLQPGLDALK